MTLLISNNPSLSYKVIDSVPVTSPEDLPDILDRARIAQENWKDTLLSDRIQILQEIYEIFDSAREDIANIIAREIGMPIHQARDEVEYGMMYFRGYLKDAPKYLLPEITRETETELHTVFYEPRGVVVAIAPWNYPFSMCIWTCMQALLAGNAVIFKTSKECILTGKLIAELIKKSSLPEGVWTEVYGSGQLGDAITDQDIDFITFTGSNRVGKGLAEKALSKSIGSVMELGGSAPGVILSDANIDKVIDTLYFLRFSNCGQMCDGLKRLIVHTSRYDEVVEKLSKLLLSKKIGDASLETTDIGPLVSENQKNVLEMQYEDALSKGATLIAELPIPDGLDGAYFAPKVLGNIKKDMQVWTEEVFGPLLPIVTFDTTDEAIMLANDTIYGLGAYIFTENNELFVSIASKIKSGMVQMNNLNYCIPENPFGGYKNSGIGREHGRWGFHEFCNIKVTSIPKI